MNVFLPYEFHTPEPTYHVTLDTDGEILAPKLDPMGETVADLDTAVVRERYYCDHCQRFVFGADAIPHKGARCYARPRTMT